MIDCACGDSLRAFEVIGAAEVVIFLVLVPSFEVSDDGVMAGVSSSSKSVKLSPNTARSCSLALDCSSRWLEDSGDPAICVVADERCTVQPTAGCRHLLIAKDSGYVGLRDGPAQPSAARRLVLFRTSA